MRLNAIALILIALLVAACGSATPTPAPPTANPGGATAAPDTNPTAEGPAAGFTQSSDVQLNMTGMPTPPPAGTAVIATASTPDPLAGIRFDNITFTQGGGDPPVNILVVLQNDGRFTRNNTPGQISAEEVASIDDYLNQINFFSIQGTFTSPNLRPNQFIYSVRVEKQGAAVTITLQDGLIPPELERLLVLMAQLGL